LLIVFQDLFVDILQLDAGIAEHLFGLGAGVVAVFADHVLDAAVDDQHGAGAAGGHLAIEGGAGQGDAELGCLADGVLLGMNGADAMLTGVAVLVGDGFE